MSVRLTAPARREQLLDVALEVFARLGYHGASMNEIADAAGVTKPVLYQHFDSKRELYLALLDAVGGKLIDSISKATSNAASGKAQTEQGFRAYFHWVHEDRDAFSLLFNSGAPPEPEFAEAVRRVVDHTAEAIAPLIAVDVDEHHRRTVAHGLAGLAEGVSRQLVTDGMRFDPDVIAQQVSDLAWAGLRAIHRV